MDLQYEDNGAPFVMWGDNKIQLENWPITEKFYTEKAETELRETPEVVAKALQELRELLKGENNLNIPVDNDDFLMKFLRPCKFYADSALKKIQAFYKFRQNHENYCHDLMPSVVRAAFDHSIISILAPRDQHGRRIMFVESGTVSPQNNECFKETSTARARRDIYFTAKEIERIINKMQREGWDPRAVPLTEVFRGVQLGLEAAMTEPRTQVCGVNVIMDMKGLTFSHVLHFTPSFAKVVMEWVQECIPIRVKAVHIVNQPYIFNMVFALFKPFLTEKLRSRIHFHGANMDSLKAHVDGTALRVRHGGSLPELEVTGELLWKMLSHYEDSFKLANSYGYVKSK